MEKIRYFPTLDEFCEMSKSGNLIPVYRDVLADMETPVSAFKKVDDGGPAILLESVEGGEKWGRYSFLITSPRLIFRSKGEKVELLQGGEVTTREGDPLSILKEVLSGYRPVGGEGLPRFYGGAVGYIGYDMVRFFEDLPDISLKDLDIYDCVFFITDSILIFDNLEHKIKVMSNVYLTPEDEPGEAYERAKGKIGALVRRLRQPIQGQGVVNLKPSSRVVTSNFPEEAFVKGVLKAKGYISAGDAIQVVLSQRLQTSLDVDPFNIYRALRVVNPSPYMFYMRLDGLTLVGSSPEILVRVAEGEIDLRPIAGTRPRGKTNVEDEKLEEGLLNDPKELAEHIMLVDLGRNDVGRVAEVGSVAVNELMVVERYSHVMHIVSNVHGRLKRDKDAFDALRASFPAGTLTGAPKVRAMEIIEEIEPCKRGAYGGSVGYFSFSGNMDMCITIRTLVIKHAPAVPDLIRGKQGDGKVYIQAGAGIVADSDPEKEYEETMNKARAMLKAVEMAREGLV